jgi:TatD DNase family protein
MELLPQTRYIGEVGLDDRNSSSFSVQKKVFEKIINACSEAGNKILTIHSRRADKEIVDIVGSQFPGKVVLHWFSGSMQVLERAVDAGYYFSVNHVMATSASGQRLIQQIPVNRLLTESDGPFVEYQGKPCSPLNIPTVIRLIAKLKPELVDESMVANAVYSTSSNY